MSKKVALTLIQAGIALVAAVLTLRDAIDTLFFRPHYHWSTSYWVFTKLFDDGWGLFLGAFMALVGLYRYIAAKDK